MNKEDEKVMEYVFAGMEEEDITGVNIWQACCTHKNKQHKLRIDKLKTEKSDLTDAFRSISVDFGDAKTEIDKLKAVIKEAHGWLDDIVRATSYNGTMTEVSMVSVCRKAEFALDALSGMEVSDED